MKVEVFAPQNSWQAQQDAARRAEAIGFDSFASPEIANDPFIPLAMAAVATERIALRTAIAVAFPRSPMVTANLSWDLQRESGGRFTLGLGTQVKAHNERRFSVPWSAPASRLREYVQALRAIWRCWEKKERLKFEGDHYNFSLMTPEFSPPPTGLPPVPIYTAAVRPRMLALTGEVCDGVRLHGFCTRRYLHEVALPAIEKGLKERGKPRSEFEICGGGFICTGPDEAAVARQMELIRYRIAFYGSTPAYRPVLSLHGWDDLGDKLHGMSRTGKWEQMAAAVPDDVVHAFTAVATWDGLKDAVQERFGGISDRIELDFGSEASEGQARELLSELHTLDTRFEGACTDWDRI